MRRIPLLAPALVSCVIPLKTPATVVWEPGDLEAFGVGRQTWVPWVHPSHEPLCDQVTATHVQCSINGRTWIAIRAVEVEDEETGERMWGWANYDRQQLLFHVAIPTADLPDYVAHELGHAILGLGGVDGRGHTHTGVMARGVANRTITPEVHAFCRERGACP